VIIDHKPKVDIVEVNCGKRVSPITNYANLVCW